MRGMNNSISNSFTATPDLNNSFKMSQNRGAFNIDSVVRKHGHDTDKTFDKEIGMEQNVYVNKTQNNSHMNSFKQGNQTNNTFRSMAKSMKQHMNSTGSTVYSINPQQQAHINKYAKEE